MSLALPMISVPFRKNWTGFFPFTCLLYIQELMLWSQSAIIPAIWIHRWTAWKEMQTNKLHNAPYKLHNWESFKSSIFTFFSRMMHLAFVVLSLALSLKTLVIMMSKLSDSAVQTKGFYLIASISVLWASVMRSGVKVTLRLRFLLKCILFSYDSFIPFSLRLLRLPDY